MANAIQVVLQETVETLGRAGDVVKVRPGYARNYLVPRGIAIFATDGNVKRIEHARQVALRLEEKRKQGAEGIAAAIAEITLRLEKPAGENGRLFGSVTSAEVADALQKKGYEVDKKKVVMPDEAVKEIGTYDIVLKLDAGVRAVLKLEVAAEEA